ncbi:hypothetical protein [Clostridium sp.]|uniref:hypothetical protein n=1 Tax=Clostridium sp. TaxID=1506 RepID=UPI00263955F2|nr:hypothetical protein [Clostridium sp.]
MKEFTLINIFKGFIKNYINFDIKIGDLIEDINNKEMKYFIILGQILGFDITNKKNEEMIIEVNLYKDNNQKILTINRENDLLKDINEIEKLILNYKKEEKFFIEIIETSSVKRIEYLNNIIIKSGLCIKKEILVIYIIKDILNYETYFIAYLFNDNKIIDNKIAYSYKNELDEVNAILKD